MNHQFYNYAAMLFLLSTRSLLSSICRGPIVVAAATAWVPPQPVISNFQNRHYKTDARNDRKRKGFGAHKPSRKWVTPLREQNTNNNNLEMDREGRRIRKRQGSSSSWDDFDPLQPKSSVKKTPSTARDDNKDDDDWGFGGSDDTATKSRSQPSEQRGRGRPSETAARNVDDRGNNGWGDFDPLEPTSTTRTRDRRPTRSSSTNTRRNDDDRKNWGNASPSRRRDNDSQRPPRNERRPDSGTRTFRREERGGDDMESRRRGPSPKFGNFRDRSAATATATALAERKINMKALENAGFVHLYGLAPVLNALRAGKRDLRRPEDMINIDDLDGEALEHELAQRQRKPEAQFSPWLFVQEQQQGTSSGRSRDKQSQVEQVMELAATRNIPVAQVDKGVLNALSGDRPHQGCVLRCGKLSFESMSRIPARPDEPDFAKLWLCLDEVVDPQNLGALLRSAYFLGGARQDNKINVLVCAKNSAPPSPAVSAASAGALELVTVYSTTNLPRTLATAEQEGFRIVGASSSIPKDVDEEIVKLYELGDVDFQPASADRPTILVLGSEGHGLRNLVSRTCTEFVRIGGGGEGDSASSVEEGVDSLNVSVTGGILLWHLLHGSPR